MTWKWIEFSDREYLSQILIVIDEIAELMHANPVECEKAIGLILKYGKKVGIYMVASTNEVNGYVLTNYIRDSFPSKIVLKLSSSDKSYLALGSSNAVKLLGSGDMFLMGETSIRIRGQSAFVPTVELEYVVQYLERNNKEFSRKEEY